MITRLMKLSFLPWWIRVKDRQVATALQLSTLMVIEGIINNTIQKDMKEQMHYKDIYNDCKCQLDIFKGMMLLGKTA